MPTKVSLDTAQQIASSAAADFSDALNRAIASNAAAKPNSAAAAGATAATTEGYQTPQGTHNFTVTRNDKEPNKVVINGGSGNDKLNISQTSDGYLKIVDTGNGNDTYMLKLNDGDDITVDGKGGDDTIDARQTNSGIHNIREHGVSSRTGYELDLEGRDGNDVLIGGTGTDVINGGNGNDYVEGGAGNDRVEGGNGKDVLYGLDGNDVMYGGADDDYLDGGAGNDTLHGGNNKDIVSGGRGNDRIFGDAGRDVLIASLGRDALVDGGSKDVIYAKASDTVQRRGALTRVNVNPSAQAGSTIKVEGSAEFKTRIASDLDTMRGLPLGQQMLRDIDTAKHNTTIREGSTNVANAVPNNGSDVELRPNRRPGPGSDATINIDPTKRHLYSYADVPANWADTPPVVILFHEMGHARSFEMGATIPFSEKMANPGGLAPSVQSLERANVGLDYTAFGRHFKNHIPLTENTFRSSLGLDARPFY